MFPPRTPYRRGQGARCSGSNNGADRQTESVSVIVAVRLRPFTPREVMSPCVSVDSEKGVVRLHRPNEPTAEPKTFTFDFAYDVDTPQERLFEQLGRPALDASLQGYNTCIFACGQTGSGKTYSMNGTAGMPGLAPRIFGELFASAESLQGLIVSISYCELYNEVLSDLLGQATGHNKGLEIRESMGRGLYVQGLSSWQVNCAADIFRMKAIGDKKRHIAEHNLNERSSRSHCIFTICIEQKQNNELIGGKINLVDLAGSERLDKTKTTGTVARDASSINKSLSNLGNVILRLSAQADEHIPYRSSKLTRLLQESLGGNSRTTMLATISPSESNFEETTQTLSYAARAKKIKNVTEINRTCDEDNNQSDGLLLQRSLSEELTALNQQLISAQSSLLSQSMSLSGPNENRENRSGCIRMEALRRQALRQLSIEDILAQVLGADENDCRISAVRQCENQLQLQENAHEKAKSRCLQAKQMLVQELSSNNPHLFTMSDCVGAAISAGKAVIDIKAVALDQVSKLQQIVDEAIRTKCDPTRITTVSTECREAFLDLEYLAERIEKMRLHIQKAHASLELGELEITQLLSWSRNLARSLSVENKQISIRLIQATCLIDGADLSTELDSLCRLHEALSEVVTLLLGSDHPPGPFSSSAVAALLAHADAFLESADSAEAKSIVASTVAAIRSAQAHTNALSELLEQEREEIAAWRRESDDLSSELHELQNYLGVEQHRNKILENDLNVLREREKEKRSESWHLEKQLEAISASLGRESIISNQLRAQIDELHSKIESQNLQISELESTIEFNTKELEIKQNDAHFSESSSVIQSQKLQIEELDSFTKTQILQIEELQRTICSANAQIEKLKQEKETQNEENTFQIEALKAQIHSLQKTKQIATAVDLSTLASLVSNLRLVAISACLQAQSVTHEMDTLKKNSTEIVTDETLVLQQKQLRDREVAVEQVLLNAQEALASVELEKKEILNERKITCENKREMRRLQEENIALYGRIKQLQSYDSDIAEFDLNMDLLDEDVASLKLRILQMRKQHDADVADARRNELSMQHEISRLNDIVQSKEAFSSPIRRAKEAQEQLHLERYAKEIIQKDIEKHRKGISALSSQLQQERAVNAKLKEEIVARVELAEATAKAVYGEKMDRLQKENEKYREFVQGHQHCNELNTYLKQEVCKLQMQVHTEATLRKLENEQLCKALQEEKRKHCNDENVDPMSQNNKIEKIVTENATKSPKCER